MSFISGSSNIAKIYLFFFPHHFRNVIHQRWGERKRERTGKIKLARDEGGRDEGGREEGEREGRGEGGREGGREGERE
jgi:hypothetical protein